MNLRRLLYVSFLCVAALGISGILKTGKASDVKGAELVKLIEETSVQICGIDVQSGSRTEEQIEGDISAKLPGLAKALAGLGLSGKAKLEAEQYKRGSARTIVGDFAQYSRL